jgi:diguanylate cyclase (GGDEF)-like protein
VAADNVMMLRSRIRSSVEGALRRLIRGLAATGERPGLVAMAALARASALARAPALAGASALACVSALAALALVALAVAASAGAASPAWAYLPPVGLLAAAGAAAASAGRRRLARAELAAAEQGALRRIAAAVVEGAPPELIYDRVAREAGVLLRADAAGVLRFDSEAAATVVGAWTEREGGDRKPGTSRAPGNGGEPGAGWERGAVIEVPVGSELARARESRAPVRSDGRQPGGLLGRLGCTAGSVAPVELRGSSWGALAAATAGPRRLAPHCERQLLELGRLLSAAIANLDERARIEAQAATDPLTGLANRRALHERLAAEVARSVRHGQTLAIAVVDIDHFKVVNDVGGHEAGDALLVQVAWCLAENARAEDTLGRLGGDEFAWVMPETDRDQALVAVERARRLIAVSASRPFRVTASAGICDTHAGADAAQRVSFADAALYWSKAHGRNRSWIYDPQLVAELSAPERLKSFERSHAVLGLQALARTIDAKDPWGREHSERVAELAFKLARASGWTQERALQLSEAALIHDVGKVGIPDELLHKPAPLTAPEREQVREHAELAARIAEGVLAPEQVEWIRTHHERPDGSGYPRGLTADEIPEGAALLAVADAWDVMVSGRSYSDPKTIEAALHECMELAGIQFTRSAVGALLALHSGGELDRPGPSLVRSATPAAGEPAPGAGEAAAPAVAGARGTVVADREHPAAPGAA